MKNEMKKEGEDYILFPNKIQKILSHNTKIQKKFTFSSFAKHENPIKRF